MPRTALLVLAAALLLNACAPPPTPEQSIVDDAAAALGGRARIEAVKTWSAQGEGTLGNLGQDMRPEAYEQTFAVTALTRRIDLAAGRARLEQTRTPNFLYFQGPAPQQQVQGIDGLIGYNIAPNGTATRVPALVASDRRSELYHHPLTAVRLALQPGVTLANARAEEGQRVVDITGPDGLSVTLAIDATTHLPVHVASRTSNANLGDVTIETTFADYQPVGELKLPTRMATTTDGVRTAATHFTTQAVNEDVGDLAAPAAAAGAAPPTPPAPTVTAEVVAPGVWWLAGQSHHSALVELSDRLLLIEAPQSEARTLAVIAKARELRPNKPVSQVVNTHHHFDHSAGIRAAIAEDVGVITHEGNRSFIEHISTRDFTIAPDALAKSPKGLKLETVTDELTLGDATRTVVLYPVDGNPHTSTMLMAYLPKERILIEADAFSPGTPYQPYAANLLENIQKRKLRVDRIVPLHGTMVTFSDLVKTQAPSPR